MPQGFADHLNPVEGPYRRQDMRQVGALATPGFDQLAVAAPREQCLEQEGLCRTCDEAAPMSTHVRI
jgi:hypothetical protein